MQIFKNIFSLSKFGAIIFCVVLPICLFAQPPVPAKPNPPRLVNDFAGFLSPAEAAQLENTLVAYNDSSSSQVTIITVNDLGDYAIEDWALEFGRKWGIGRKGKNNGVVILASKNPRKINISPGYGLEGALPDAICKRIEVQKMVPNFRTGNYYQGFASAVESIRGTIKGEFVNDQPPTNSGSNLGFTIFLIFLVCVVVFFIFVANSRRYSQFGQKNRLLSDGGFFWFGGGGSGSGWGSGSSGGSSGGGGFGGFGGGDFGGGGASSDW